MGHSFLPLCRDRPVRLRAAQSQSHITTDGQSVSTSWCQALIWDFSPEKFSPPKFLSCLFGAPSLTRGRVCHVSVFVIEVYNSLRAAETVALLMYVCIAPPGAVEENTLPVVVLDSLRFSHFHLFLGVPAASIDRRMGFPSVHQLQVTRALTKSKSNSRLLYNWTSIASHFVLT
jgi:hypothetical protein